LKAAEQNRPDVVLKRTQWEAMQSFLDPHKLVFYDESYAKTNMTRLYGRAPVGERLVDYVPHAHWVTTTLACCLRLDGLFAPYVFNGAMNSVRFVEYVEKILIPQLNHGDILVMDNLQAHKNAAACRLLREAEITIIYLPPYSPDLNPIELCFSKIKSVLRSKKIREVGQLHKCLLAVGSHVSREESCMYFKHAKYDVHTNN
jgi:transposase